MARYCRCDRHQGEERQLHGDFRVITSVPTATLPAHVCPCGTVPGPYVSPGPPPSHTMDREKGNKRPRERGIEIKIEKTEKKV